MAGSPQASFTVSSSEMLLSSTGNEVVWPARYMLRVKYFCSAFLYSLPHCGRRRGSPNERERDGIPEEARIDAAAAVKAELGIELVLVVNHARNFDALVLVQRMFEQPAGERVGVEHQVLAHQPAGVGEPLGETVRLGEQQQPRRLRAVGGNDDGTGALQVLLAALVEINRAGRTAVRVKFDLANIAVGDGSRIARVAMACGMMVGSGLDLAPISQPKPMQKPQCSQGMRP